MLDLYKACRILQYIQKSDDSDSRVPYTIAKMLHMPYCPKGRFRSQLPTLESIYRPLDREEFRLLQVHDYDGYGILRCSLRHVPFKQDVMISYSAISYTWNEAEKLWYGDYDTSPKPVRIDGAAVLVPDKVSNIIAMAVQHGKQFIWIDALCINQSDKIEKSHQVTRMGTIYSCAAEVLSFLGSPNPETDGILDLTNSYCGIGKPIRKVPSKSMFAILNLFANDYWRRAWIFQEIAIARTITIFCGSRSASLAHIFELCKHISEITENLDGLIGGLRAFKMMLHAKQAFARLWKNGSIDGATPGTYAMKGAHNTFIEVLRESRRHNGCFDPRDMLYSRMALASDAGALIPYIDYDMPVDELYKRFATNSIMLSGSLEIITFASATDKNLPTWVPDWTSLSSGWSVESNQAALKDALIPLQWRDVGFPRISRCRTELMVQGKVIRTIQKRDYEELYMSWACNIGHLGGGYARSEVPRPGDVICVLRNCPLLVYLRPVGQHYVVVGRQFTASGKLWAPETGLLKAAVVDEKTEQKMWELMSFDEVQGQPEEVFRIR